MTRTRSKPEPAAKPAPHIEVTPAAAEQEPVLANLLQLYAHEFSEFLDVPLQNDGRFGAYKDLPLYWHDPGRHPFLIWVKGKLAGFALVKNESETSANQRIWDMAEFFVVRAHRRRGIGTQVAYEIWKRFPGPWQVRVMQANVSARRFWEAAIRRFTGKTIRPVLMKKDGEGWYVFSFESFSSQ